MSENTSVIVNKLSVDCQLSGALTDADQHEKRLVKIARNELKDALQECLQPLRSSDDKIVLIRRLEMDLDVDLLVGVQDIAQAWAMTITTRLVRALVAQNAAGTVVFADAAHFLRCLLVDMARGRASQLWYYRHRFSGLRALPTSAALRTALLNKPEEGVAAITGISSQDWLEVCSAIINEDAQRLLTGMFPKAQRFQLSVTQAKAFSQTVVGEYTLAHALHASPATQCLLITGLALTQGQAMSLSKEGVAKESLAAAAELFCALLQLQYQRPREFQWILPLLTRNQPLPQKAKLQDWFSAHEIAQLTPLLEAGHEVVEVLAQPLQNANESVAKPPATKLDGNGFTWFGNSLLLLPSINRLPLQFVASWPTFNDQSPVLLVRWLVLCLCQSADKFFSAMQDPMLSRLCGISRIPTVIGLAEWLSQQINTQVANALLDDLASFNQANDPSTETLQWQWQRGKQIKRVTLRRETRKGCWLNLSYADDVSAALTVSNSSSEQAKEDLQNLWLQDRLGFNDAARTGLALLAQTTLASFAYRLPGFSHSSLSYLWRNFLCMSATLVTHERHIGAHLSRVPMSVILNMAGVNRGTAELPGFNWRPIRMMEAT